MSSSVRRFRTYFEQHTRSWVVKFSATVFDDEKQTHVRFATIRSPLGRGGSYTTTNIIENGERGAAGTIIITRFPVIWEIGEKTHDRYKPYTVRDSREMTCKNQSFHTHTCSNIHMSVVDDDEAGYYFNDGIHRRTGQNTAAVTYLWATRACSSISFDFVLPAPSRIRLRVHTYYVVYIINIFVSIQRPENRPANQHCCDCVSERGPAVWRSRIDLYDYTRSESPKIQAVSSFLNR